MVQNGNGNGNGNRTFTLKGDPQEEIEEDIIDEDSAVGHSNIVGQSLS
jgi:hypothetical protein